MLYGLEMWVMTLRTGRVLGGVHHRVSRRLTVRRGVSPLMEDAIVEAGLQNVDKYVSRFQNTVAKFIETRLIVELCVEVYQRVVPAPDENVISIFMC